MRIAIERNYRAPVLLLELGIRQAEGPKCVEIFVFNNFV